MPKDSDTPRMPVPRLRKPNAGDGAAIWALVKSCKPLDENSMYCNLVQVDHFRDTCVVAGMDGEVVGWTSGHMIRTRTNYSSGKLPSVQRRVAWVLAAKCCLR